MDALHRDRRRLPIPSGHVRDWCFAVACVIVAIIGCSTGDTTETPAGSRQTVKRDAESAPRQSSVKPADRAAVSPPASSSTLLALVPSSVESVFCVEAQFAPKDYAGDTLRKSPPAMLVMANYFTSRLASDALGLLKTDVGTVACAVGACEAIEVPKPDPTNGISAGFFRSHRCEWLMLSKDLPVGWLPSLLKRSNVRQISVAGDDVASLDVIPGDREYLAEHVLIVNPAPRLLVVANDATLLAKVLKLHHLPAGDSRPPAIDHDATFLAAAALIARPRSFWGVRLFGRGEVGADPTSVRNAQSILGFFDSEGVFAAVRIAPDDGKKVALYYGSNDSAARARLTTTLGEWLTVHERKVTSETEDSRALSRSTIHIEVTCESKSGDTPAAAIFGSLMSVFGQGFML
jgi:hypothetical protein